MIFNVSKCFLLSLSKVSNPLFDKQNCYLAKPLEKYCSFIFMRNLKTKMNHSLSGRILFHQETHPAKVGRKLMTRPAYLWGNSVIGVFLDDCLTAICFIYLAISMSKAILVLDQGGISAEVRSWHGTILARTWSSCRSQLNTTASSCDLHRNNSCLKIQPTGKLPKIVLTRAGATWL